MKKTSVDMTTGSIAGRIISFAIPILLGQVFQNLYNSVDSIVVGNFVGTTALAAVSVSFDISRLIVGFFAGLSVGSGILLSRYFGSGDYEKLHDAIHSSVLYSIITGIFMTIVGIAVAPILLKTTNCPEDVFPEAKLYLNVYLIGVLFTAIYNVGAGVLRAVGDSKSPFRFLVIASLTNIALDLLFICCFHLGVMGVALATIISQLLSVILVFRNMILTEDVYKFSVREMKFHKEILKEVFVLGMPAAIQSSLISFSNIFVQGYFNVFGTKVVAGSGAGKKIDKYVGILSLSIGQATATFISQNLGAGKRDRAFRSIPLAFGIGFFCMVIIAVPTYFFAGAVTRIFTDDAEAIKYGVLFMHTLIPFFGFQVINQVFMNVIRGFGKSFISLIISVSGMVVFRQIYLAVITRLTDSVSAVFLSFPIGWMFSAILNCLYLTFAIYLPYLKEGKSARKVGVGEGN